MSFWKSLGKVAGAVVKTAAPVVIASVMPEAMVNTAAGAIVKHGTKISNNAIPYVNLILSTAVVYGRGVMTTGDWGSSVAPAIQQGVMLMTASTALHQSIKLPLKGLCPPSLAGKIGPGERCSF